MKQATIDTGFFVPRYGDPSENQKFFTGMASFLGLPENWTDYFRFTTTLDFITLQGNEYYKAEIYRRFKRMGKATIPSDLKGKLQDVIDNKNKHKNRILQKEQNTEAWKERLSDITGLHGDFAINYINEDTGLMVTLTEETKSEHRKGEREIVSHVCIAHSGKITEPVFSLYVRYSATISQAQKFIDNNKGYNEMLLAKATEIKGQLPSDFFTTN